MTTTWTIDKSALARILSVSDSDPWATLINRGLVYVCPVTLLEMGFSARNVREHVQLLDYSPLAFMPIDNVTPRIESRALDVQRLLSKHGHHRAPSVADLLIAATAEINGHTVLHVDKDFELISMVTDQPVQRLGH